MMLNDSTTVRGYTPEQNTGRMNTAPYQPAKETPRWKQLWKLLDPVAVALLAACVLGLAYALYATISFWWLTAVLPHLVVTWLVVVLNGVTMVMGHRRMMLLSAIGYAIAMLLFINYMYLLIPQAILCLWAWWKAGQ